jgi:hypothetical protein
MERNTFNQFSRCKTLFNLYLKYFFYVRIINKMSLISNHMQAYTFQGIKINQLV